MVLLDKLDQLHFCTGMPAEYLRKFASVGELKEYPPGAYVFREGQRSACIYVVIEGQVALEVAVPGREPTRLQVAGRGDLVGWSPVLGLGPMTASARTLTHCRVTALDASRIVALGEDDPRFLLEVMRRVAVALAARLNATRLELLAVSRDDAQAVS
jgi:CRP-like cAMP-binding protein